MIPRDRPARDRILADLDTNLLVEAAAGTGKTTSLAGRMTALIRTGRAAIEDIAAVTFTRKAAAELRARFSADLAAAARAAAGEERARLAAAAQRTERCFVGTIHSFCARLLRERPIEAGVDVAFRELEEAEDALLREEAWSRFVGSLFAAADPRLDRLAELGLAIGVLKNAFLDFALYPDVEAWPAPDVDLGDLAPARAALESYLAEMERLLPGFPADRGTDKLMARYEQIARLARHRDLRRDADLMHVLELFTKRHGGVQKCWSDKKQGQAACERWNDFSASTAAPLVALWREKRYATVIPLLRDAVAVYDALRAERGVLNYQDLLLKAAHLLRADRRVRAYFRRRFTHLLVDEFQDTDPLQAEVVLYLTAADAAETDWRRCRPAPGSLFVVGDPKQSIYRFRRADIATYSRVKRIIVEAGGAVVPLDTNFRALPSIVDWVNAVFAPPVFPEEADAYAPAAHPLAAGRPEKGGDELAGLRVIEMPDDITTVGQAAALDAERIARFIRHALDTGLAVPRTPKEQAAGLGPAAVPGDFLVVTWGKKRLALYSAALQRLGVPHQVTGGSAWEQVGELKLLASCVRSLADPDDPVALVAVLRGGLFGFSDAELFDYRCVGGRFSFTAKVPADLDAPTATRFAEAFDRLRRYASRLRSSPPVAALERIAADLGLILGALAAPGGTVRAGSIGKAFAILREAHAGITSIAELARCLEGLIAGKTEFDGIPARADEGSVVRVMNLHKAKGLEAPVVFLADPGGAWSAPVAIHVDRQGDRIAGYLAIREQVGENHVRSIALPPGWEERSQVETRFAEAERTRLCYVAATRAGAMLTVTRWPKKKQYNRWEFFSPWLREAAVLTDPGEQRVPSPARLVVPDADVDAAARAIGARWAAVRDRTYEVRGAKEVAVSAAELHRPATGGGELGTAWGTVIHFLLETALRRPEDDLRNLARTALEEQELDPALAEEALATVAAVRASGIWERAQAAAKTLVEVPFEICLQPDDPILCAPSPARGEGQGGGEGRPVPLIVRGVIDLVFRDAAGWVIVDWKTDAGADRRRDALVEHYRGQVELYADIWGRITGEPPAETGLFFISSGEYVILRVGSQGENR